MPNPIILGSIVIYAREVFLDDGKKAFSVVKYSTPELRCRVPFNQTSDIAGKVFVRPAPAEVQPQYIKDQLKDPEGKYKEIPFPNPVKPDEKSPFPPIDRNAPQPPVRVSDPEDECDVGAPFLKYEFKEGEVRWVVLNKDGARITDRPGRLSELFREYIEPK